ncbi:MAG: GNAT family N-acetyltransferase [Rhizobiales bacterium]|nr:GNAT family N-acetyltransferase [Hyphomicrobiales bacterium]MBI3672251.1 GNAT family N-acetyltransferase [Hyphomicrobiales bacterium]
MTDRDIAIRDAVVTDASALAGLAVLAGHGLMDVFYGGLVPGKSTRELVLERRILWPGGFCAFPRWRVAVDGAGHVIGGLNSFPHHLFESAAPDPLVGDERWAIVAALSELEAAARDSYYVNMIAVAPEARKMGLGSLLMVEAERMARAQDFATVSLATFAGDPGLVSFYRRLGYAIRGTRPIAPHPTLEVGGDWALMAKDLGSSPGL